MMGVQAASAQLFYDFCLDDHVPSDHLLRSIDGHLDFEGLRQTLKPFYSQIGRPSIDPFAAPSVMTAFCAQRTAGIGGGLARNPPKANERIT